MKRSFYTLSEVIGLHVLHMLHPIAQGFFGNAAILGQWHKKKLLLSGLAACKPKPGKQFMNEDGKQRADK